MSGMGINEAHHLAGVLRRAGKGFSGEDVSSKSLRMKTYFDLDGCSASVSAFWSFKDSPEQRGEICNLCLGLFGE